MNKILIKKDEEGFLYFVNRKDSMLKSSGYRISPTEIEQQLYENNQIKHVIATGIADEVLGQKIRVFINLKKNFFLSEEDIINYCKERYYN